MLWEETYTVAPQNTAGLEFKVSCKDEGYGKLLYDKKLMKVTDDLAGDVIKLCNMGTGVER